MQMHKVATVRHIYDDMYTGCLLNRCTYIIYIYKSFCDIVEIVEKYMRYIVFSLLIINYTRIRDLRTQNIQVVNNMATELQPHFQNN